MELSIIIARIIAVIYLVSGMSVLLGNLDFGKISKNLEDSPALLYISAMAGMITGTIVLYVHNIWSGWQTLITLFGWGMLLGGSSLVLVPGLLSMVNRLIPTGKWIGIFMILVGLLFAWFSVAQ